MSDKPKAGDPVTLEDIKEWCPDLPKDWFASFGDRLQGEAALAKMQKRGLRAWSDFSTTGGNTLGLLTSGYCICVHSDDRIAASEMMNGLY